MKESFQKGEAVLIETPKMKKIYSDIQSKLFYMIPEGFDKIYLYASIIEQVHGMPIGEMYFYYFPKGLLKKRPVNVYEIPNKFNIEDEAYSKLINDLYLSFKQLREEVIASGQKPWTNLTLSIENFKFSVEYYYDDLTQSPYSNFERHIIWRYEHLQEDIYSYNRKERELLNRYLQDKKIEKKEVHQEAIYSKGKPKNILGYRIEKAEVEEVKEIEETEENIEKNQILNVHN